MCTLRTIELIHLHSLAALFVWGYEPQAHNAHDFSPTVRNSRTAVRESPVKNVRKYISRIIFIRESRVVRCIRNTLLHTYYNYFRRHVSACLYVVASTYLLTYWIGTDDVFAIAFASCLHLRSRLLLVASVPTIAFAITSSFAWSSSSVATRVGGGAC